MRELFRKYPENIKTKDTYLFKASLSHIYNDPLIRFRKNLLWDNFGQKPVKGLYQIAKKIFAILLLRRKVYFVNKLALVTNKYSENYFHFINDAASKMILLQENKVNIPVLFSEKLKRNNFAIEITKLINHPFKIYPTTALLLIKKAVYPEMPAGEGNQDPELFLRLRDKLTAKLITGTNKKIFITRPGGRNRTLYPKEKIENLLKEKGFLIIDPSELNVKEQADIFYNCSHLVAAHGAGLTNMIFMKGNSGSRVLEIRRKDDSHNNCYHAMANTLGLQYFYFLADSKNGKEIVQEDDFLIEIEPFNKELFHFLN